MAHAQVNPGFSQPDEELIALELDRGDGEAFGILVRRHQSALRFWLRRLCGDHSLADDLAQETLLIAYKKLGRCHQPERFLKWLFGIGYNAFRNNRRTLHTEEEPLDISEMAESELVDNADYDWSKDLEAGFSALTPEQASALTLVYLQGMSHSEAAEAMDCPIGSIKTHILRGKEKLKRYFEMKGEKP